MPKREKPAQEDIDVLLQEAAPYKESRSSISELRLTLKTMELEKLARPVSLADILKAAAKDPIQRREAPKIQQLLLIRKQYKWPWSAGAEYLYREIIRAHGLQHHEHELLQLARPTPGRKKNLYLQYVITLLRKHGATANQIKEALERHGVSLSTEGVESYFKTRRKR